MADRKAFNFYKSYWEQMKLLNDKQRVQLLDSICKVQFLEINIEDVSFSDKIVALVWAGVKHSVSTSLNGFVSKNKGLGEGVNIPLSKGLGKGGAQQVQVQEEEQVQVQEEEKGEVQEVYRGKRFSPPTQEEIKIYCLERKNKVDPIKFFDFYESKGWMVGKTKMKDWKASVRTWEKNEKVSSAQNPKTKIDIKNAGKFDYDEKY